jgi:MFS transporter, AAHS family, 4-hydroxybenzoate transporter
MADQTVVPVSRLLDERGLTSFHITLMAWTVLLALIDGYDIAAIAVASPHLVREWHLPNHAALGPVLSASLIGILFGSAIFGWIGDRYGRKVALIASNLLFGILTWIAAYATNLEQMFWLRLIAGIGIGGVIPNVVAINAESAPRRLRATLALVTVGCVPLGGAFPGIVADLWGPTHGWQMIFLIGGIVPVVVALAAIFGLSESIKFMTLHESQRERLVRLIKTLQPDFTVPPNAKFVIEDERQFPGFNPVYLFREGLAVITPLLWLLFALNLMGFYFLLSWTPTLLVAAKLPMSTAGLAISSLQVGGTVGALLLARWFERQQFLAIALVFLISVPVVAAIGYVGADDRHVLRRVLRARRADRHQCRRRAGLSDVAARQRFRLGAGYRPHRLDRRPAGRRAVHRHASAASLCLVVAAVSGRRGGLLHHPPAEPGATARAAISSAAAAGRGGVDLRTARSRAAPGSPSRRTAGSSA